MLKKASVVKYNESSSSEIDNNEELKEVSEESEEDELHLIL